MCNQSKSSAIPLIGGLVAGVALGAGAVLLFGTKKGKEIQGKIKKEYPEIVNLLEDKYKEVSKEVKKTSSEAVEDIHEAVDTLTTEVKKLTPRIGSPKKRFVKNGRKL